MGEEQQDKHTDTGLATQLLSGGVGLRHVRRTLRELRDHREDLVQRMVGQGADPAAAGREAQGMLGDQRVLIAQMIARPELRSRARRFAWLLFVVGPVPMVFAVVLLLILALAGMGVVLKAMGYPLFGRNDPDLEIIFTKLVFQWVAPAIVGTLLCRAAIRRQMPAIWPAYALAMVALGSACTYIAGVDRVTGIYIGWHPQQPGMMRAVTLFCACSVAYLLMRRRPHAL